MNEDMFKELKKLLATIAPHRLHEDALDLATKELDDAESEIRYLGRRIDYLEGLDD